MSKKDSKTPAPPKRPQSAFFLYKQEVYTEVKSKNPSSKITEITKIIAEQWKTVPETKKKELEELHAKNKKQYDIEKKEYEDKYGKPEKKEKKSKKDKADKESKKKAKKQKPKKECEEEEDDDDDEE